MDYLPKDPAMLVSAINMLLRDDEYDSFESLCSAFDREPAELLNYLHDNGYRYDADQRQLKAL